MILSEGTLTIGSNRSFNPLQTTSSDGWVLDTAKGMPTASTLGLAIHNFVLVGTIRFGINAMDRNAMLADISDIQYALDKKP